MWGPAGGKALAMASRARGLGGPGQGQMCAAALCEGGPKQGDSRGPVSHRDTQTRGCSHAHTASSSSSSCRGVRLPVSPHCCQGLGKWASAGVPGLAQASTFLTRRQTEASGGPRNTVLWLLCSVYGMTASHV